MSTKFDIEALRKDFPSYAKRRPGYAYLDSGASSLTPQYVMDAMDAYYIECRANVHRGMYAESMDATDRYESARAKIADFVNASPEEIIFTRGTTESLNLAASCLARDLRAGDEVVISIMEHHANLVPWQQMAKRQGFTLKFVPIANGCEIDLEAAEKLITPATKIVSMTAASNVLGTLLPAKKLADIAHAVGAIFILDAAQLAGHGDLDVMKSDCDLMAFSAHKMYGPTGIGVLYGKKHVLKTMPPYMYGGDMIIEVTKEDSLWNDIPYKFEAGTPNIAGAIGFGAAIDWITSVGLEAIRDHEAKLVRECLSRVSEIPGIRVHGPCGDTKRGSVVSMTLDGVHPHDLTDILGRQGVCVRGGHHCAMPLIMDLELVGGTTRASFGAYNSSDDINLLVDALKKAVSVFHR